MLIHLEIIPPEKETVTEYEQKITSVDIPIDDRGLLRRGYYRYPCHPNPPWNFANFAKHNSNTPQSMTDFDNAIRHPLNLVLTRVNGIIIKCSVLLDIGANCVNVKQSFLKLSDYTGYFEDVIMFDYSRSSLPTAYKGGLQQEHNLSV